MHVLDRFHSLARPKIWRKEGNGVRPAAYSVISSSIVVCRLSTCSLTHTISLATVYVCKLDYIVLGILDVAADVSCVEKPPKTPSLADSQTHTQADGEDMPVRTRAARGAVGGGPAHPNLKERRPSRLLLLLLLFGIH